MAALALAVVAVGCSAGQEGRQDRHHGPYDVDPSGRERVLTIHAYGGMTAANYQWAPREAQFLLYGDGRVLQSCTRDESSPSLLPCLSETHVSPDEIQLIVAAADKAGLMSDREFDDYLVTDADTTVFDLTVGGSTHRVQAYGLFPDYPSSNLGVKVARMKLIAFSNSMTDLGGFLGRKLETQPYAATSLQVRCDRVEALGMGGGPLRAWPLAKIPGDGGDALTLTGDDMASFVASAGGATVFTVWTVPGGYCRLSAHPLLPDE